jgi:hypothetical protein
VSPALIAQIAVPVLLVLLFAAAIRIVREYERVVVFRLGRLRDEGGPGLVLVAIHPDPLVVVPRELGWTVMHKQAEALLRETRDAVAPDARIDVETDWSVPRALERVAMREHRDLLVVGSSRGGPEGRVRIGKRTRQLLCDGRCALAVAPRGLSDTTERQLARVGVGYEGGPESQAALSRAGSIAVPTATPPPPTNGEPGC